MNCSDSAAGVVKLLLSLNYPYLLADSICPMLFVKISKHNWLPSSGTSDPYATIHIISSKKEKQKDSDNSNFRVTKVEFANLNPKWNESFTMLVCDQLRLFNLFSPYTLISLHHSYMH
jgi:hypothetical protein